MTTIRGAISPKPEASLERAIPPKPEVQRSELKHVKHVIECPAHIAVSDHSRSSRASHDFEWLHVDCGLGQEPTKLLFMIFWLEDENTFCCFKVSIIGMKSLGGSESASMAGPQQAHIAGRFAQFPEPVSS